MKLPVAPVDMRCTNISRTLLLTTFQRNDFVVFAVIVLKSRRVGMKSFVCGRIMRLNSLYQCTCTMNPSPDTSPARLVAVSRADTI